MNDQPGDVYLQLPWTVPGWQEQAGAWVLAALERLGRPATAPIEWLHARVWSTVARVPAAGGAVYFKAVSPSLRFEPPLAEALARWRPDCMPAVLALDVERGWLLTADAGAILRSQFASPGDLRPWDRVLPLYAEVQIALAAHTPELLALGLPDRRLAVLPEVYAALLDDTAALRVGLPDGLTPEQLRLLRDWGPRVTERCAELAAYGLPETIVHEEVHDANVIAAPRGVFFSDWSDSSAGHPFCSLTVIQRAIAHRQQVDESGPEMARLRDIYLEPWARFASRDRLLAAAQLAYRLGMIYRSLSWHNALRGLPAEQIERYADSVPGWLQDFAEAETKAGS